ncbi:hypothetical protein L1987_69252 [Smallanthus sonchifolius]|uniref:Uncharacterized protein n=1 Tax=Smallanthus sonchifolius TaxID=185202 RepID=A0ACB9B645_9ASTR|nr:hypothetical protein L1987_69252 [Smallanthus sonchifolius]
MQIGLDVPESIKMGENNERKWEEPKRRHNKGKNADDNGGSGVSKGVVKFYISNLPDGSTPWEISQFAAENERFMDNSRADTRRRANANPDWNTKATFALNLPSGGGSGWGKTFKDALTNQGAHGGNSEMESREEDSNSSRRRRRWEMNVITDH